MPAARTWSNRESPVGSSRSAIRRRWPIASRGLPIIAASYRPCAKRRDGWPGREPGPLTPGGSSRRSMRSALPRMNDFTRTLRRLIWLYFWLLLFEGALRKWFVPGLSNALLIVRDPVAVAIYALAVRDRVFPASGFILWTGVLAALGFLAS